MISSQQPEFSWGKSMEITIKQCPRCSKLFTKIRSAVCEECTPDEEADLEKVRELLDYDTSLNVEQAAEASGISIDVILRMVDEGNITSQDLSLNVECGRCGGRAISLSKRLCESCVAEMDANFVRTLRDAQLTQRTRDAGSTHKVHDTVLGKLKH